MTQNGRLLWLLNSTATNIRRFRPQRYTHMLTAPLFLLLCVVAIERMLAQSTSSPCHALAIGTPLDGRGDCTAILAELRESVTHSVPFGIGGIESSQLCALVRLRYLATDKIQEELDCLKADTCPEYAAALYFALGAIRDPASIPWVTERLSDDDAPLVFDYWLSAWRLLPTGRPGEAVSWLDEPTSWSQFFVVLWRHELATDRRRDALMAVACRYFHDQQSLDIVAETLADSSLSPDARLIGLSYLYDHGYWGTTDQCMSAINELRGRFGGDVWLINVALAIPLDGFVPVLLDVLESTGSSRARDALRRVTLRTSYSDAAEWRHWYAACSNESRSEWTRRTCEQCTKLFLPNVEVMRDLLRSNRKYWNDIAFLPLMQACMPYGELHEEIAAWVVATYRPAWDKPLREITETLLASNLDKLDPATRELLGWLGRSEDRKGTWEEYVCRQERVR